MHCQVEEGTKRITQNFFKSQTKLKSVHIPNSVQVIEDHAFTGCTSLEAVNFPEGLERRLEPSTNQLLLRELTGVKERVVPDFSVPAEA